MSWALRPIPLNTPPGHRSKAPQRKNRQKCGLKSKVGRMDSWEWPLFLLPFWHLSPSIPFSSNVHVLFSCPDCAPNTHLPFGPYCGLCFLSSFQALHLLTLRVLFCGSCIQTHWSGVEWQVGQVSRVLPPLSLALRGHYAICHGFRTCLSRLREHTAPSCPGGKGQEQHELLDSPWVHMKPF